MKMNIKKLAAILFAILFAINTAAMVGMILTTETADNTATAKVEALYTPDGATPTEVSEKESADRILLIDESGSMNVDFIMGVDFDETIRYSDSKITENILNELNDGASYIVYVTDMKAYPDSDLQIDVGNHENVYLAFGMTEDVPFSEIGKHKAIWESALNEENSTLIFVYPDGSEIVVFDNYTEKTAENVVSEEAEEAGLSIKVETESTTGDSISFKVLVIFMGTIIDLFLIFGIIVAVLMDRQHAVTKKDVDDVPDGIQDALKDITALDGSGSVAAEYKQMVDWAERMKVSEVYRFASDVKKMSVEEAKKRNADGNTHGWECLKELFDAGERRITIVSDMDFNDDESVATGISFDHINFVIPAGDKYNKETMEKVAKLAKSYKVERI